MPFFICNVHSTARAQVSSPCGNHLTWGTMNLGLCSHAAPQSCPITTCGVRDGIEHRWFLCITSLRNGAT